MQTEQADFLREGERIDDLQRNGLRIIQRSAGFRFGTDAVLLADFARAKKGERVCDMGTGTGVLPLLIAARSEETVFDAFEVQEDVADMALRSVCLNGMEARIHVHHADCREAAGMAAASWWSPIRRIRRWAQGLSAPKKPERCQEATRIARWKTGCMPVRRCCATAGGFAAYFLRPGSCSCATRCVPRASNPRKSVLWRREPMRRQSSCLLRD